MLTQTTLTQATIESDGNINMTSEASVNLEAVDAIAKEDINIEAKEDVTIAEAKETKTVESDELHGEASVKFVIKNEYAKIAFMAKEIKEAKEAVDDAKDSYDNYKSDLSHQKQELAIMKEKLKNGEGFIEQIDVDELSELIEDLEEDKKYYEANIALATAAVATKITPL